MSGKAVDMSVNRLQDIKDMAPKHTRAPIITSLKDRLETLKEMGYDRNDPPYLSLSQELLKEQEAETMELWALITEPATEVNNNG